MKSWSGLRDSTRDLLLPKQTLCQAEPSPSTRAWMVFLDAGGVAFFLLNYVANFGASETLTLARA